MNIEIDYDKLWEKIWPWRIIYFMKLLKTITKKNEVDLWILNLPEWTFNTIRHKFIKEWIIKKCKFSDDTVRKYYMNPIYGTIVKDPCLELYNAFDEVNEHKIY